MNLSPKEVLLQRVEETETSYCNDDPLAVAKGVRNGILMVMPFWLGVAYFVL